MKEAVLNADAKLAAISRQFDLVLMVTPLNTERAFEEFRASNFERPPSFVYRPKNIDPPILKRELYNIQIEKVDDPALAFLLEEKRRELCLKLTLVEERETRRFLPSSIALYGDIDHGLTKEATEVLDVPVPNGPQATDPPVDAKAFAMQAEAMLRSLRNRAPIVTSRVEMHDELTSLTVSNGNLLVGSGMTFPASRVEALLNHEVGTHVVTHWNGSAQPLQLMEVGLAGYDALQEGLAVFAEYLVGGLTQDRLRTLAVRVVTARMRIDGASFIEAFRQLTNVHGFSSRAAFLNTVRVFRGGGLVKDAVYFRGFQAILDYVGEGGALEYLLIGKVAAEHVPLVRELQKRKILKRPLLLPPYLGKPDTKARLEHAKVGLRVRDLLDAGLSASD